MKKITKKIVTIMLSGMLSIEMLSYSSFSSPMKSYAITNDQSTYHSIQSITDLTMYPTNELIIRFKDNLSNEKKEAIADVLQVKEERLTNHFSIFRFNNRDDLKKAIDLTSSNMDIKYIQPNYNYKADDTLYKTTSASNGITYDKYSNEQWALHNTGEVLFDEDTIKPKAGIDINIEGAWNLVKQKETREIIVAVVDTGIDYDHVDLVDHMWVNKNEIPDNHVDDDKNGYIDDVHGWNFYDNKSNVYSDIYFDDDAELYYDDHGTHCAGIIAATSDNEMGIAGVASKANVKVMSVKALGGPYYGVARTGSSETVTKAIEYAEDMGAKICNLSLGTQSDGMLYETIKDSKMLFVVAAGNGDAYGYGYDIDEDEIYPASYNLYNIISVANLNYDGNLEESSNYGIKSVDIAAPGSNILSTRVDGKYVNDYGRYTFLSGTSMAAPMVTGVAALLYSYHDTITIAQAKRAILQSARQLNSLNGKVLSGGMLDATAALSFNIHAPIIKMIQTKIKNSNRKVLNITITDPENNVSIRKYAVGIKTLSYFKKGKNGVILKSNGSLSKLTINKTGYYTIYAIDQNGNEAIQRIKVTIPNK